MNIGHKISQLRKEKGVTQEQLAAFTGVSVAAVSKWETDSSYPDITLLPLIAEFFEVSVDALLDFDLTNEKLKMLKDANNKYVKTGDFEAGLPLYEEAINKYPNDFDINFYYGDLLLKKAFSTYPADTETAKKAVKYLEKAILLHPGYGVDINSIRQAIAYIYGGIGEYDKAINMLNETGEGTHDIQISDYLIKQGNITEAKRRLQGTLFHMAFIFSQLTELLAKCFIHENDNETAGKLDKLCVQFREVFADSEKPNYFNLLSSSDYGKLALAYKNNGRLDDMWDALNKAVAHAERFDMNPSYAISDIEFMSGYSGTINTSFSTNACHNMINLLNISFIEFSNDNRYIEFMNRLNKAKQDKKQSGIWE